MLREKIDLNFVHTPTGQIRKSVPSERDILATYVEQFIKDLTAALHLVNRSTSKPYMYWEVSRVVEETINTVPLESLHRDKWDDEERKTTGLKYYRPWFVSNYNSASNMGTANHH